LKPERNSKLVKREADWSANVLACHKRRFDAKMRVIHSKAQIATAFSRFRPQCKRDAQRSSRLIYAQASGIL